MLDQIAPPTLRLTDCKTLLRHLARLGASDPEQRAEAALAASDLLRRKGVPWTALIPIEREDEPIGDWPASATRLLDHPNLTTDERAYVKKVAAWRSPRNRLSRPTPSDRAAAGRVVARRGNGAGYGGPAKGEGWGGQANGEGWGGPARGIGHNSGRSAPFEHGNKITDGQHSFHRYNQRRAMLRVLIDIAFDRKTPSMLQVRACTAALNILDGPCKPMDPARLCR